MAAVIAAAATEACGVDAMSGEESADGKLLKEVIVAELEAGPDETHAESGGRFRTRSPEWST